MKKILTISLFVFLFTNICFAEGSISHKCNQENQTNLINDSIVNYSLEDFAWEPPEYLANIWFNATNSCCINTNIIKLRDDDITWYIENFRGYVNVYFEVVGYGFSNTTKQTLEEEIREAIQKIIDLHFPKEKIDTLK